MLTYAQQILELEKIARLEARPAIAPRALPRLTSSTQHDPHCIVCSAPRAFACSACGVAHYCTPQHQGIDAPFHDRVCDALRESVADAEFLHKTPLSELGRALVAASAQLPAQEIPSSFDQYLAARASTAEQHRILTDLASRPLTLARLIHALVLPVDDRSRDVVRIHVAAASAKELESLLLYTELTRFWPRAKFDISFIGPELPQVAASSSVGLRFAFCAEPYARQLWPRFGQPDLVVAFNAGLLLYRSWQPTLAELIGGGVPFAFTSYRSWEARAEAQVLTSLGATPVLAPAPNPFASRVSRRSSTLINDVSHDNSLLSVWR
jgi:hypothetical protein